MWHMLGSAAKGNLGVNQWEGRGRGCAIIWGTTWLITNFGLSWHLSAVVLIAQHGPSSSCAAMKFTKPAWVMHKGKYLYME